MTIDGFENITMFSLNEITDGERYKKGERARIRHRNHTTLPNEDYDVLKAKYFKSKEEAMIFMDGIKFAIEQMDTMKRFMSDVFGILETINTASTEEDAILELHCLAMNSEFQNPGLLLRTIAILSNKDFNETQLRIIGKILGIRYKTPS